MSSRIIGDFKIGDMAIETSRNVLTASSSLNIRARSNRVLLRIVSPFASVQVATEEYAQLNYQGPDGLTRIGLLNKYVPFLELEFRKHGQLLFLPFILTNSGTTSYAFGVIEGILTEQQ